MKIEFVRKRNNEPELKLSVIEGCYRVLSWYCASPDIYRLVQRCFERDIKFEEDISDNWLLDWCLDVKLDFIEILKSRSQDLAKEAIECLNFITTDTYGVFREFGDGNRIVIRISGNANDIELLDKEMNKNDS